MSERQPVDATRPVAILLFLQVALLVVGAAWVLIADLADTRQQIGQTIGETVLILVLAACAAALAIAVRRGWDLAKTPVLLWGGMVALCGLTLATAGAPVLGVVVGLLGLATIVTGSRLRRYVDEPVVPEAPEERR